jgi:hypothetical protein
MCLDCISHEKFETDISMLVQFPRSCKPSSTEESLRHVIEMRIQGPEFRRHLPCRHTLPPGEQVKLLLEFQSGVLEEK